MTTTPEDILKKLKPTKAFDLTPESMEAFAGYVINLGPTEFVARWLESTTPKKAVKVPKPKTIDPRISEITARLAKVAKATKLTAANAAVAFINFSREADNSLPEPTATAKKGPASAVQWLISKSSLDAIEARLSSFEEQFA
jgi:hypothetical protein